MLAGVGGEYQNPADREADGKKVDSVAKKNITIGFPRGSGEHSEVAGAVNGADFDRPGTC